MKSLIAFSLLLPTLAFGAQAPTGQLNFALQTAGHTAQITKQPQAAAIYESLRKTLQAPTLDGATVLKLMRELEPKIESLTEFLKETVDKAVDPKHKFTDFITLVEAKEMRWAQPIWQYAAGDESDEEPVYVTTNHDLRDSKPDSKKTIEWTTSMRQALSHLPKTEGLFFRGSRLTPERVKQYYAVGKPASDAAFISTSLEPSTAMNFATPGVSGEDPADAKKLAVIFVVLGRTGRPVSKFAYQHAHEQEILFANGTPMTVKAKSAVFKDSVLGQTQVIYLTEDESK